MKRDIHEQARELIACSGAADANDESTAWLRRHLQECVECRDYADSAAQLASALHSIAFAADATLVRSTQIKVRARAEQLRQQNERMRLVWLSCCLLSLSGAATTPLLWRSFHWIGEMAQVPGPVWKIAFGLFWIAPAIAISIVLIARGIHFGGTTRGFTE
jgi:predicted anti-sigma-YlaC factor YlaD